MQPKRLNPVLTQTATLPVIDLRETRHLANFGLRWSRLVAWLPMLCAVHCALMPGVILAASLFGGAAHHQGHSGFSFEWLLFAVCAALTAMQWLFPIVRQPALRAKLRKPIAIWFFGIALTALGVVSTSFWPHAIWMFVGSMVLIAANRAIQSITQACGRGCQH